MTVLPATLNIKVAPFQVLQFDSASHTADENGIVRDVRYDTAIAMIKDPAHPAELATEADLGAGDAPSIIVETSQSIDTAADAEPVPEGEDEHMAEVSHDAD